MTEVLARSYAIVGTGVAARALGPALQEAGIDLVAVSGRNEARASVLAADWGTEYCPIQDVGARADNVLLCVSDDAVAEVCSTLSAGGRLGGRIVVHLAGALPLNVLEPAANAGALLGKLHPIASLSGGSPRLRDIVWGIDGSSDEVFSELRALVQKLDGLPLDLGKTDLAKYHLASVFASNFMLAVLSQAVDLWIDSGAPLPASEALIPLARTVLANWEDLGLENALTGPIVRGDVKAVVGQLRAVNQAEQHVQDMYLTLALATAGVALKRGGKHQEAIADIARLLAENKMVD